jgi:hypothetical protein
MNDEHRAQPAGSDGSHGPAPAETAAGRSYFPAYVVSVARWNLADLRIIRRANPPAR